MKINKSQGLVIALYFALSVFFLRGVIFSPGVIQGGDWGFPLTTSQMLRYVKSGLYTWNDRELFGSPQFFLNALPFQLATALLAWVGINGEPYVKLLMIAALVFPAYSMYHFCRFLNFDRAIAVFGGFLYMTLPFFFNYLTIGWLFVHYSLGILPISLIFFIRSVNEERVSLAIVTGLLFFLAMIQSQSFAWYPLVVLTSSFFLVKDRQKLLVYGKSLLVVLVVFLGMSCYWSLPLILSEKGSGLSTGLALSSVSLGTWARLNPVNILRLWGSLFNYQYEVSYPEALTPLSFLLPFLAYANLLFPRCRRLVYSLVFLAWVPLVLFVLGPTFVARLPFSDFIRDIARFLVLSSFAYVVLALIVLSRLLKHRQAFVRLIGYLVSIFLVVNTYPFWAGELSGKQKYDYDVRLRTYNFPTADYELETELKKEGTDTKVLYLPIGSGLALVGEERFLGPFNGIRDIFGSYSVKQGLIGISDKGLGSASGIIHEIRRRSERQEFNNFANLLGLLGIKHVVVREYVEYPFGTSGKEISSLLSKEEGIVFKAGLERISLLENINPSPHFYVAQDLVYSSGEAESLLEVVNYGGYQPKLAVFLDDQFLFREPKYRGVIDRTGKIFITSERLNKIQEQELGIVPYLEEPFISISPSRWERGSLLYRFSLTKEEYDKWRLRGKPIELFNLHLLLAHRRMGEISALNDRKTIELLLVDYAEEMREALGKIVQLKENGDLGHTRLLAKFEGVLWSHQLWLKKHQGVNHTRIFADLQKMIEELKAKRDFSRLVYQFDIPKEGEYETLIREGGGGPIGGETDLEGWVSLGKIRLEKGRQEFVLPMEGLSGNLVDRNLRIGNYDPNSLYRISFDYYAPEGTTFFVAEEGRGRVAEVRLLPTGGEYKYFEMFFRSSAKVERAIVHLALPGEKNLRVEKVYQPELLLLKNVDREEVEPGPPITFMKVNPTKYRLMVQSARRPYTLVFSESFHPGWKAYIGDQKPSQEYGNILASYFGGEVKEGTHRSTFLAGDSFVTWGKKPIDGERHLLVNGYANSWYITPQDAAGEENYEIIIEFRPQQLYYLGLAISVVTLISSLFVLGLGWSRGKKNQKDIKSSGRVRVQDES